MTLIDPVRVHSSTFAVEAHLVKLALESNEIPCALKNELLSGLGGAIGFDDARVEVWVARVDAEDALHLVAELTKTPRGNVSIASAPEGHGELSFTGGGRSRSRAPQRAAPSPRPARRATRSGSRASASAGRVSTSWAEALGRTIRPRWSR